MYINLSIRASNAVAVGFDPGKYRCVSLGEVLECAVMDNCGNLLLREFVDLHVLCTWDAAVNWHGSLGIFVGKDISGLMPDGQTGANLLNQRPLSFVKNGFLRHAQ